MKMSIPFSFVTICSFVFFSCSKNNSTSTSTGTGIGTRTGTIAYTGPSNTLKTQTAVAYATNGTTLIDSVVVNFGYDAQGRLTGTSQYQMDAGRSPITITNASYAYSYAQNGNLVSSQTFANGSATASVQHLYYLNASSYLDSAITQSFINGSWHTTDRESYTYDGTGYANKQITFTYDSVTGSLKDNFTTLIRWNNGDRVADSAIYSGTPAYVIRRTYFNALVGTASNSYLATGPYNSPLIAFKGLTTAHVLQSEAFFSYVSSFFIQTSNIDFTFAQDGNNRLSTLNFFSYYSSTPTTKMTFTYY